VTILVPLISPIFARDLVRRHKRAAEAEGVGDVLKHWEKTRHLNALAEKMRTINRLEKNLRNARAEFASRGCIELPRIDRVPNDQATPDRRATLPELDQLRLIDFSSSTLPECHDLLGSIRSSRGFPVPRTLRSVPFVSCLDREGTQRAVTARVHLEGKAVAHCCRAIGLLQEEAALEPRGEPNQRWNSRCLVHREASSSAPSFTPACRSPV
jgi:hypothetical protein